MKGVKGVNGGSRKILIYFSDIIYNMSAIRPRSRPKSVPIMMNRNTQKKSIRVSSSLSDINKRSRISKSATHRNRSMRNRSVRNRSMRNRSKSESSLVKLFEGDKKTKSLI